MKLKTCIIYVSIMSLAFTHHYKTSTVKSVLFKTFVWLCAVIMKKVKVTVNDHIFFWWYQFSGDCGSVVFKELRY